MIFRPIKKQAQEPIWLTVFCDMTTNLMLFFLLLYGFTRMSKTRQQQMYIALSSSGNSEKVLQQKADGVLKKFAEDETSLNLQKMMSRGNLKKYSSIETSESQIRLVLNTPVLFDSGRAKLKPGTRNLLGSIARTLSMTSCPIVVEGHTDNVPIKSAEFHSNWELSARRAVNVINYFVKRGLPPERFIAAGYGEYFPRFSNDYPLQRQKNRRIEIVLLKEEIE